MPIKVTTAREVIEVRNLCMTIYSQPGLGKTSLAFTANKPLLLDFDHGATRAKNRKDIVEIDQWSDVAEITKEDVAEYDTIVIDTVGKALDCLAAHIVTTGRGMSYGGALNQQGWGQLGVRFSAFLKLLRGFGKDVVLIAHMEEKHDGDAIKERLKIQGGSNNLVQTDSDVIARISVNNKARILDMSPTETGFGKDPANIGSMPLPDLSSPDFPTCLADIFDRIKSDLNSLSEEQVKAQAEMDWFKSKVPEMTKADELNDVLERAKKAGVETSKLVVNRAKDLGFDFDPERRKYVTPEQEEPEGDLPDEVKSDIDDFWANATEAGPDSIDAIMDDFSGLLGALRENYPQAHSDLMGQVVAFRNGKLDTSEAA